MDKKTLTIRAEAHEIIKEFCQERGLKIMYFIEQVLLSYIEQASRDDDDEIE